MDESIQTDAVVFDLFGTLVEFHVSQLHRLLAEMADSLGIPFELFLEHWSPAYAIAEISASWTVEDQLRQISSAFNLHPDPDVIALLGDRWRRFQRGLLVPKKQTLDTLQHLRVMGLKLGLLSNCPPDVHIMWPHSALAPLLDVTGFSSEMALRKPDLQSYRFACRRLSVQPHHALFMGDGGSQELSGAAAAGLRPVQLRAVNDDPVNDQGLDREQWHGPNISRLGDLVLLIFGNQPGMIPNQ